MTPEARALALFQAGQLAEAEAAWRAILAAKPDDAEALHVLGCVISQSGRREEGLALLDRSLDKEPRNAAFLNNRARVLAESGRAADALRDLRRAVQIEPALYTAFVGLGNVLKQRGDAAAALASYDAALAANPAHASALYHRGSLLLETGDYERAEAALRKALEAAPPHASLLTNLGLALQSQGRLAEAIALYARAVEARPDFAAAHVNWGNALKDQGDLAGAQAKFEQALAHAPGFAEALNNAAGIALDRGRIDEARERYREAARVAPAMPGPRYGLAQIALREQRFDAGWDGYEERFAAGQAIRREPALPALGDRGLDSVGKLALWSEQGVGDQILFSTLLPDLARRGVKAVVEVDPRLAGLYQRSLPAFEFTTPAESARAFASCDAHLALGSLPRLLRRDAASFAQQPRALLQPQADRVSRTRERLGPGRWIAISWRSLQRGERKALGERKSIPLEHFAQLAQRTAARLLDLQYGDVAAERAAFAARHPGVLVRLDDLDTDNDFEGVAAAIAACERVVTSSNVTAHLAGAIGQETDLVFLDGWPPFHYWTAGPGGRSLWYPSVRIAGDPASI